MDIDTPVPLTHIPRNAATVLCANCGAPIDGTTSAGAFCHDCIKLNVDVSEGIQREATLHTCRDCDRWLSTQHGTQWIVAAPESRELLALCLKKLRGLNKVRIIDASFIWTEPHSRRVKVKIVIQQEAYDAILQQSFEVEFVVAYQQCPDCQKSYTHNTWRAVVQVRQKVPHKRTFLYLEQLILKHGAHRDTINIKEVSEGIDFFYGQRNHAVKFVDFLSSVVPVQVTKSQELISKDVHTSTKSYKFSYSVELVPVCKDDLVALPIKLANSIGNISPLVLCHRIGTSVNVVDPSTLQTADISTKQYWHQPFAPLADVHELVQFVVLDIEPVRPLVQKGRFLLADVTVAPADNFDTTFVTTTHLGGVLHPGDEVMGYYLSGANFNNPFFEAIEGHRTYSSKIPDVVLVKKHYARKKKNKNRNWRVKRMAKEESEMAPRKQDADRLERDFEMFLRDVEEDEELRNTLKLYKNSRSGAGTGMDVDMDGTESENDELRIPMEQLHLEDDSEVEDGM